RAMEIIDELEPTRRGAYAGSVMYFDYSGNLDSCIVLRTMYSRGRKAYVQAGGGIVADSPPEMEVMETVSKSRALIRAIEIGEKEVRRGGRKTGGERDVEIEGGRGGGAEG